MGKTIRLTSNEKTDLESITLEINKELINRGEQPLKDTEVFHYLAEQVMKEGEVTLNAENRPELELNNAILRQESTIK